MVDGPIGRSSKGFTLIEMAVVVMILGVMLGMVMPSLVNSLRQRATQGAVYRLTAAHALARTTAVRFGRVGEQGSDVTSQAARAGDHDSHASVRLRPHFSVPAGISRREARRAESGADYRAGSPAARPPRPDSSTGTAAMTSRDCQLGN